MTATVTLLSDPDSIVETLSPIRRRLLALLAVPDSATGLANQLGATRQLVNYHLRTLEAAGLVEVAETRRRRGLTENVMRRTTDVILVDPAAFDTSGPARSDVVGVIGVVSLATDLIRRAAKVAAEAGRRGERVAAASLDTEIRVSSPAALRSLLDEVAAVVAAHDSGDEGLRLRVSTAVLPGEAEDAG